MTKKIKPSLKKSKLPWVEMEGDGKFTKHHVLYIGKIDVAYPDGEEAHFATDKDDPKDVHTLPVLTVFAMDCNDGTVYIRGDLGELGGLKAVSVEQADEFILEKLGAIREWLDYQEAN